MPNNYDKQIASWLIFVAAVIFFMIILGGFIAVTKAGYAYNTFPLMAGKFIPDGMYTLQPFWLNWFENITAIQFNHRMIAFLLLLLLLLLVPLFAFAVRRLSITQRSNTAALLLLAMLAIQVTLGVITILMKMPVVVAVSHQGGAIILLTIMLFLTKEISSREIRDDQ